MTRLLLTGLALGAALAQPVFAGDTKPTKPHSSSTVSTDIVKTAAVNGKFKTLVSLLIAADLSDTLRGDGPFTVFAPTDDAFKKLPPGTVESLLKPENKAMLTKILTYHVISGKSSFKFENGWPGQKTSYTTVNGGKVTLKIETDGVKVNDAKLIAKNVACTNGSIQIIDEVLMPTDDANTKSNRIPAIADKAGTFKTLLAALKAAELADVLNGDGPFTVFAPTDDAFAKLPEGTIAKLLKPENRDQLVAILKYHVVSGSKSAKDLVAAGSAKTLQSSSVSASIVDGRLTVNQSGVVKSDIKADNGVVHVIDRVLIPAKH